MRPSLGISDVINTVIDQITRHTLPSFARRLCLSLTIALAGCIPASIRSVTETPNGVASATLPQTPFVRRVDYAGLTLAVPSGVVVTYPEGIDSNLIAIKGEDFSIDGDDYGVYKGGGNVSVGGQPARRTESRLGLVLSQDWDVKRPTRRRAHAFGKDRGHVLFRSHCKSTGGCRAVATIIRSVKFTS